MKIQYASDLHIEFPENKEFLKTNPLKPIGDTLVLAGDIVPFAVLEENLDFFSYLSDNFENTYWIPGNHEYYYYNLADKCGIFNEKITNNVHLLNNCSLKINNINFVFTTLWSHIKSVNQWQIYNSMNDFRLIKHGDDILSVEQYNILHKESIRFLNEALSSCTTEKSVVVSHHLPTFMNYPEKYKGDVLNEAFAVELYDMIQQYQPDFWIYGHTHGNTDDFTIGKTNMVTNQFGYLQYEEHKDFNSEKYFEL
ncbi:MAG: metallophosphoesterase [Bacteroidales bacterium]|nr:metallophosphoesterase [Bacteroidales bacterium]